MRILVDIDQRSIKQLDAIARMRQASRAAVIREAVHAHLKRHARDQTDDAFGLWGSGETDGLAYQEKIRGEW